jgi:hypothetical protein
MYVTLFGDRRGTLPTGWTKETIVALMGDARIHASTIAGRDADLSSAWLETRSSASRPATGSPAAGSVCSATARSRSRPAMDPFSASTVSVFGDVKVSDRPSV